MSEKVKTEAHIDTLNTYGKDFQFFFDKGLRLIYLLLGIITENKLN